MSPGKIKKTLERRLAYLEVVLERRNDSEKALEFHEEERSALQSALEKLGLFDEEALARRKEAVATKVMPIIERRRARVDVAIKALVATERAEPKAEEAPPPAPSSELMLADHAELVVRDAREAMKVA